jgi:hypothetical protein
MSLHDQRIHAAKLLRQVERALHTGKPCSVYMPMLKEATRTVADIATKEVVIASGAKLQADEVAR